MSIVKRILITGKNSYIGKSLKQWLERNYGESFSIKTTGVKNNEWTFEDFKKYDVIIHVAGIVHQKENNINESLYYKINKDLTYEIAKKAKGNKVKHFIFLSSMSVYGVEGSLHNNTEINKETVCSPKTLYGKSKLAGENKISDLKSTEFKISIVRPPMIYGRDCPGNYDALKKIARYNFLFPEVQNQRSMLFIDNLCMYLKIIIDKEKSDTYFPQNKDYISTTKLIYEIKKNNKQKMYTSKFLAKILMIIFRNNKTFNKVYGDLVYSKALLENLRGNSEEVDFINSVKLTEGSR